MNRRGGSVAHTCSFHPHLIVLAIADCPALEEGEVAAALLNLRVISNVHGAFGF